MDQDVFHFRFDRRFRRLLGLLGIRPSTSRAVIDDESLRVEFGRLGIETPVSNIDDVRITRNYRWYKAIGVRVSLVDRGLTFGTNSRIGACVCFREPVPAVLGRRIGHPALTVTLEDPEQFAAVVRRRIGS